MAFTSLVRWTKHDVEKRRDVFPDLLTNVKLQLLSTTFLEKVVFVEVNFTLYASNKFQKSKFFKYA